MDWIRLKDRFRAVLDALNESTSLNSSSKSSTSSSNSSITLHAEEKIHLEEFRGGSSVDDLGCSLMTCKGECQGMGECNTATRFRNAIVPPLKNKPHKIGCNCKKCHNMKLIL